MSAVDLSLDLPERAILEQLDQLVCDATTRAAIAPINERMEQKLFDDPLAVMAWEPVPLETYQRALPAGMLSSWVFILRARATTGAERHPNSHQRVMSYAGCGDLQTGGEGNWESHPLVSEQDAPLERRWLSIPPLIWHQAVVAQVNWVVVSFHTVRASELIEERPEAGHAGATRQRTYLDRQQ